VRARSIGTRARSLVDARLDVLRTYGSQRATHVELDHKALQGNVGAVRAKVGARTEICAVVKGNAYGHGAVDVARTVLAAGADRLAVATVAEAVELRRAGIDAPVLVLGATTPAEAEAIVACDITATVTNAETALALATAARKLGSTARVHLKVNTGMNRLGVRPDEAPALLERLRAMKGVHVEGIFTHFHSADVDLAVTRAQLASFTALLETLTARGLRPKIAHAAASDALLALPESHLDMVRPGTALYGMVPGVGQKVLSWKTSIAHVNELKAGETVSYGATWTAPDARRVAVIPVGWSDGLQAGASRFKEVLVGGVRCPIVGSITMDQAMVDVTAVPNAGVGDEVVLIGGQGRGRRRVETTVEEAAKWLGDVHPVNVTTNIRRVPVVPSDSAALATWTFARVEPTSVPRSRGHVVRSARSP
jgi:alanine racemase